MNARASLLVGDGGYETTVITVGWRFTAHAFDLSSDDTLVEFLALMPGGNYLVALGVVLARMIGLRGNAHRLHFVDHFGML